PTTGGYLTIIRDRNLYYDLTARGLRVEIDEKNSRNLSDPQFLIDTFYGGYKSVEEIYAFLDQKVAQFPNLVEKIDIGDSWCKINPGSCVLPSPWDGYDLFVLHITNRNVPGPKPVFWADGNIHAREIATPEVVMRMIDYLLNNYNTNADVQWLVDYHDIWLMPEVNPDGHHIVEAGGGGNSPYLYRKNGNNVGGSGCSWPPTASSHFGVDNNRNFPFHWGCCNGQSFLPSFACIDSPGCGSSQGIWPENRGMLLYLAKIARTPYLTSHGPDANTVVTNPASVPQGVPSQLTASTNFAWSNNAFNQNVGAAEYYIDMPPWAGGTAIPMNGTFTSPTVAVDATINTASLSVGRHVIFVRGRGVSEFQGF